jgi:hypothetical protein
MQVAHVGLLMRPLRDIGVLCRSIMARARETASPGQYNVMLLFRACQSCALRGFEALRFTRRLASFPSS